MKDIEVAINSMEEQLMSCKTIKLEDFDSQNTLIVIMDMNNGFAKAGALYSNRVENMIDGIAKLSKKSLDKGMKVYAYTDNHVENAKEFDAYPSHCVSGTEESDLVESLKELEEDGLKRIEKNSTNGVLAYNPLKKDLEIRNIIVVGCVTDICVYQYAVTLRAYLNQHQLEGQVYVAKNYVETFNIEEFHDGDLMQLVFLKSLMDNGVKIIDLEM